MFKRYKFHLIISTVIMLLPIVFGLCVWNKLPEEMPIHWGINGEPDDFASKTVAVFLMPLIPLVIYWICILATALNRRAKEQNSKIIGLFLIICPAISIVVNSMTYLAAFGKQVDVSLYILLVLGIVFVLIGNYLPKCKQNRIIGLRIKWTLEDEDNWHATHRLSGKLWILGGIAMIGVAFLPDLIAFLATLGILITITVIPIVYSYRFSRKKKSER